MIDTAEILDLYSRASLNGHKMVLATVVDVDGSAYRRPGAHLLVSANGKTAGSISAGCLESDILARHEELFSHQKCLLLTYENDELFGLNYGCDGTISVLVQPVISSKINFPTAFADANRLGRQLILATVFDCENEEMIGRSLLASNGRVLNSDMPPSIERHAAASLLEVERGDRHQTRWYEEVSAKVFFQIIKPTIRLVIFGAGDDVVPLIETAKSIGMEVRVSDSRRSYLDRHSERTNVYQFCSTNAPNDGSETDIESSLFDAPERTAVVIMSHSFELDKRFLEQSLKTSSAYIGVVGSRKRTDRLLTELNAFDQASRLHYPIGLDIGSETSAEIALAIVSEILAFFRSGSGRSLTEVSGAVHDRRKEKHRTPVGFAAASISDRGNFGV